MRAYNLFYDNVEGSTYHRIVTIDAPVDLNRVTKKKGYTLRVSTPIEHGPLNPCAMASWSSLTTSGKALRMIWGIFYESVFPFYKELKGAKRSDRVEMKIRYGDAYPYDCEDNETIVFFVRDPATKVLVARLDLKFNGWAYVYLCDDRGAWKLNDTYYTSLAASRIANLKIMLKKSYNREESADFPVIAIIDSI